MAMDVVTLGILLKKINDSLSGISNVSYNVATNEFEFTNATTGQVFTVTIPNMHQHTNSSILSLLDVDANGSLTFNGVKVAPDLTPTQIDELKDIIDTIEVDVTDGKTVINGVKLEEDVVTGDITVNGKPVLLEDDTMSDSDFDDELDNILGI